MIARIGLTVSMLGTLFVAPWATEMILTWGRPATFAVLAPLGFVLGSSFIATVRKGQS